MGVVLTTLTEVTVTASAAAIEADHLLCQSVILTADAGNAGTLYIGDSNLDAANGIPLTAGQTLSISDDKGHADLTLNLNDLYVIGTNTDKLRINYLPRKQ